MLRLNQRARTDSGGGALACSEVRDIEPPKSLVIISIGIGIGIGIGISISITITITITSAVQNVTT